MFHTKFTLMLYDPLLYPGPNALHVRYMMYARMHLARMHHARADLSNYLNIFLTANGLSKYTKIFPTDTGFSNFTRFFPTEEKSSQLKDFSNYT